MTVERWPRWADMPEFHSLPDDWTLSYITDIADVIAGQSPPSETYNSRRDGLPFLQGCAEFGDDHPSTAVWCSGPSKKAPPRSTLMSVRAPVGNLNRADQEYAIGRGLAALVAKDIDSDYLHYGLHRWRISFQRLGQGSTFEAITARQLRQVVVALPKDENEQRRIAGVLRLADDAINKARAELDATLHLKHSLLSELFECGLPGRHSEFVETKQLTYPADWTLTKLKKCGIWSAGGTPDRETVAYYEGTIPWVKSGEVNYCTITETEEHLSDDGAKQTTCGVLPVGTLLIAMYGAGVTRGRVALLGVEASTNQAVASFNGHEGVENEFIYYWFERNYQRVRAWAAGSNQDNLSGFLLKSLPIAMPDHDEQIEIVKPLKAADAAIRAVEERIESLKRMKRSLLQNLLTGKIRIPEGIIHA